MIRLRPRWRKVLADLWDHKARTALVVASIAVGVFAVGVVGGAYSIISNDLNASYAAANPANIEMVTDAFESDLVDAIARMDGIADAEGRREVTVRVRIAADKWDSLTLVALSDFDIGINKLVPLQGAREPDDREVILERKTMASLAMPVGGILDIELPDGVRQTLTVVGSAQEPTAGYAVILGDLGGFITLDTLERLEQPTSFNRLLVTVTGNPNDRANIERVSQALTDRLEKSGRRIYYTNLAQRNKSPLSSILTALLGVLGMLGVLIVFLSGSLIANTMSALLGQHLRQIGVMKLIGARRDQIGGMYLVFIIILGLVALVLAIPPGIWAANALSALVADIINFVLRGYRIVPGAIIAQIVIALLIPPIAGIAPVWNGTRLTIQQAISSTGLSEQRRSKIWLDRQLRRARWLSRPLAISIRNTFRRKRRLALTLLTLTLGGAIFIAVFNTQAALNLKVKETTQYFRADVNMTFSENYRIAEVTRQALVVPGVERVEVWTYANAEWQHADGSTPETVSLIAPPVNTDLMTPILLEGRWLLPEDGNAIAINEGFWADYPNLHAGDTLRLKINEQEDDWLIVGVFQYTGADDLIAYVNRDQLAGLLNQTYRASSYRVVTTDHTLAFQQDVAKRLEQHFKERGFRISEIEAGGELIQSITQLLGILITVLLVMALLTALVGSIGLAGTMSMNVLERTREIGVLRGIGGYDQFIARLVVVEGMLIGLLSYLVAAALSFPITSALSNVVSQAIFDSPAHFAFKLQGFVIWLLVVVILSVLASLIPARNASRLTIREVLAYE